MFYFINLTTIEKKLLRNVNQRVHPFKKVITYKVMIINLYISNIFKNLYTGVKYTSGK